MQGVIHNYKRGRHRTSGNQMIVHVDGVDSKEKAEKLVGKAVTWSSGTKEIAGEIRAAHGNSGAVRVLFSTGMPGQAIGTAVTVN